MLMQRSPILVIFDTDMWGDIDDLLALAMIHSLQARGEVELLAVTCSTDDKWCAPYISAVNTFYGCPDIPIGMVRDGVGVSDIIKYSSSAKLEQQPNYTHHVAERRREDGSLVYPHSLVDGSAAPDAVQLLRETLVAQPDNSVVIIEVGYTTNLARLLRSQPDKVSALDGYSLVREKVRLLSMMAGNFGACEFGGKTIPSGRPEFNVVMDLPSAELIFATWPTPIVASGLEIGLTMLFKGSAIERDFSYVEYHPVVETYRYMDAIYRTAGAASNELHDHATFDLTSVLYAARPDDGYFSLSEPGSIVVLPDGGTRFDPGGGTRRHMIMTDPQRARALEAMTLLVSQPPVR
jgi:inosine-uridine nucleoside N-ribohydrolase